MRKIENLRIDQEFKFLKKLSKVELFDLFIKGSCYNLKFIQTNRPFVSIKKKILYIGYNPNDKNDLLHEMKIGYIYSYVISHQQFYYFGIIEHVFNKVLSSNETVMLNQENYKILIQISSQLKKIYIENYQL